MIEVECGFSDPGALQLQGPTIDVRIGFDEHFAPGSSPSIPETLYPALIDTGASDRCIDSGLAAQLKLPVVDQSPVAGVGERELMTVHLAHMFFPSLQILGYGRFIAVHLVAGGQKHQALLGRDFLSTVLLTYDGLTGKVTIQGP